MDGRIQPIDVVILTKNSEQVLEKCIMSIYTNVPVRKLIVVDGYSKDRTLEILQTFNERYGNVEVIHGNGTRARARQKGIENVQTDWFMFVDSDVVLCKDWFKKAIEYVDESVGAVWGIEIWSVVQKTSALRMFLWITRKIFEIRGGTHDTLIRFKAVEDIKIPKSLHVFEDAYIKEWITKKGYKVIACYDPHCRHYRPENVWTFRGSINIMVEAMRFGNLKILMRLMAAYSFYTAYVTSQMFGGRLKKR
jgi:glycosyltransferase involved in cell wall biosynthesis